MAKSSVVARGFHSLPVSGEGEQNVETEIKRNVREVFILEVFFFVVVSSSPPTPRASSLVVVVFLLLPVGQRGAGPDLPVAVQPLLHHLSDQRVVPAPRALLQGHEDAPVCHAAVQPLPQQLLLLLFITHFLRREEVDVQQLPLTVHQRQECDSYIVVCVEVGARASIVKAVVLHGDQSREVAARVSQSDGALPAETLLP